MGLNNLKKQNIKKSVHLDKIKQQIYRVTLCINYSALTCLS